MKKIEKWELIKRYMGLKNEASLRNIRLPGMSKTILSSNSFEEVLEKMNKSLQDEGEAISFFSNTKSREIKAKDMKLPRNIDAIILFDEYEKIPFLSEMDKTKSPFLFIRGHKENIERIFNTSIKNSVSAVGSRETPAKYIEWIENILPKNKIIVSGLANGADLMSHRAAIKQHDDIVVFPGYDISLPPSKHKMDVWEYALKNGVILSSVVPGAKTKFQADLLKRNHEMARVVSETYALYFGLKSGTLSHLKSIAEGNKKIIVPEKVFNDTYKDLQNNPRLTLISRRMVIKNG